MAQLAELITPRTRLVSLVHVSNMLGCTLPAARVAEMAHAVGARLLLDCCQSVPNQPVDVQALGADWIVASGHKMCGPTGIGFLWGRCAPPRGLLSLWGRLGGRQAGRQALSWSPSSRPPSTWPSLVALTLTSFFFFLSPPPGPAPCPPPPTPGPRCWSRCRRGWAAAR